MATRAKFRAFLLPAVVSAASAVNGCTVIVGLQLVPPEYLDEDGGGRSSVQLPAGNDSGPAASGSTPPAQGAAADAGPDSDSGASLTAGEDAAGSEAANPDGEPPIDYGVNAFQVVSGTNLKLKGMTSDGWIVYFDTSGTNSDYKAVSIAAPDGGANVPKEIYHVPEEAQADALVLGRLAFTWGTGVLTLWSSSLEAPVEISETAYEDAVWVSADSQHFVYLDANTGGFFGVNGDGTRPTTLLASSNTADCSGGPLVQFQGDYVLISSCPSSGAADAFLSVFNVADSWSPVLSTPETVPSLLVDPQATVAAVPAPTKDAGAYIQVFPIDGGSGTVLDPNHPFFLGQNTAGALTYPWFVLYNDQVGDLWRAFAPDAPGAPDGSALPQMLVDGGVTIFEAISPQGDLMEVANQLDDVGDPLDLSLVSTTNAGPSQPMASDEGTLMPFTQSGSGFTENEEFAVFYSNVQVELNDPNTQQKVSAGQYNAMQTSWPFVVFPAIATNVFDDVSLTGGDVLLLENTQFKAADDGGGNVVIDLEVVDIGALAAAGGASNASERGIGVAPIVLGIPREVALTSDHTRVAYVVPFGSAPGIYIAPIPSP